MVYKEPLNWVRYVSNVLLLSLISFRYYFKCISSYFFSIVYVNCLVQQLELLRHLFICLATLLCNFGYHIAAITGMLQLFPSPKPVVEKIRSLPNRCDRQKCCIAYNYLIARVVSPLTHISLSDEKMSFKVNTHSIALIFQSQLE